MGSNLDDPESQVRQAFRDLEALPGTRKLAISSLYQTRPVGPQDQDDFINAVTGIETGLAAPALLEQLQGIEHDHHRQRTDEQWGPRSLDLDLLLYGSEVIDLPELTVPHPEMHRRCFVLQPLHEIAPDITIPGHGKLADL
ncbi:MAG: 2-amino-4-hydroxy-6-hydroxymethyldihydropteridine diphosphokinase [Thiotrichales bacterium]|nr:2-amino-4-hydroxy-6-hydroxymethyldihydropteridine diphosphokinase [Thiotrichales bacterium]